MNTIFYQVNISSGHWVRVLRKYPDTHFYFYFPVFCCCRCLNQKLYVLPYNRQHGKRIEKKKLSLAHTHSAPKTPNIAESQASIQQAFWVWRARFAVWRCCRLDLFSVVYANCRVAIRCISYIMRICMANNVFFVVVLFCVWGILLLKFPTTFLYAFQWTVVLFPCSLI